MLQDDLAPRVEDEAHIEESILPVGMPGFRLGNDEGIAFARELAEDFRLLAGNIDCPFAGKLRMIQVQNFVVESSQSSLRNGDQPHRQV